MAYNLLAVPRLVSNPACPSIPAPAATYQFNLNDALVTPPITYRYFICLYSDDQTTPATISRRAGASVDVVRAPLYSACCRTFLRLSSLLQRLAA